MNKAEESRRRRAENLRYKGEGEHMNDKELLEAMRRIAQPDEHRCFGCGYEHGCSLHGCAVILEALERLEELAKEDAQ